MKSLIKIIKENAINIFEGSDNQALQHFMTHYESDGKEEGMKEYLERYNKVDSNGIIKVGKKAQAYIKLEEIKNLYDYADKNNAPCPIIVNYHNAPGCFVFRRWVHTLNKDFEGIDLSIDQYGVPYMGLHNTNMSEDGKKTPSSEDYESVISYAYNKLYNRFKTDIDNIKYVTSREYQENSKLEMIMNYCSGVEHDTINEIVKKMGDKKGTLKKLPSTARTTSVWYDNGNYGVTKYTPNHTPKTDIIEYNGSSVVRRISVKKAKGSQLMSGYEQESRATLISAAKLIQDRPNECIKEINKLFDKPWLRNLNPFIDIDGKGRQDGQKANKSLSRQLNYILDKYKGLKEAIVKEAMTGEIKFGKNSPSTADCVFVWNDINPQKSRMYSIDEYMKHVFSKGIKFNISLKTSTKTSSSMRIETK